MLIFAMSGGKNRRLQKESVSAFVPRNEIAKITTGGTEGHDAHPFLRMHLRQHRRIRISRRRGSIVSVHYPVRRLAMPVS